MLPHPRPDVSVHGALVPGPRIEQSRVSPIRDESVRTGQQPREASRANPGADSEAFIFIVCASQPPRVVDLSVTLAKLLAAYQAPRTIIRLMCRNFRFLAVLFRIAMASFVGLFFLPRGLGRDVLSIMMPSFTLSVVITILVLSADIFLLLTRNYEFWFLTIMNTPNWVAFASIMKDIRVAGCFAAWFAYQSVILVDANHRTFATTLSSTIASTPILIVVAVFVIVECISDGSYFEIHFRGRKICDVSDLVMFTTSTLVLFFVKLLILKKTRSNRSVRGFACIRCATLKTTLRLIPSNDIAESTRPEVQQPPRGNAAHRQELVMSTLPFNELDARRTLIPYPLWRNPPRWILRNASRLRAMFYGAGFLAFASLASVTLVRFYALWVRRTDVTSARQNALEIPELARFLGPQYSAMVVFSSVATTCFCGGFVLFFQRDLLRLLLWSFDFMFTITQPIVFLACLCDINYWAYDAIAIAVAWDVWFVWALSLDALTPLIKHKIFRFQKRFAAPILASVIMGTAATSAFVLFADGIGLRDRVVWSHTLSSGVTFSIRSQAVLLGRSITIVMWCSHQAYLLLARGDDELNLIRGGVEYLTPFPLISSVGNRAFVSTRSIAALPLSPVPAVEGTLWKKSLPSRTHTESKKASFGCLGGEHVQ